MLLFFWNIICNYYKRENRKAANTKQSLISTLAQFLCLWPLSLYYVILFSLWYVLYISTIFLKKAVCDGECLNGGECRKVDPYLPPKCVCTANFTGNYCEKRKYFNITLLKNQRIWNFSKFFTPLIYVWNAPPPSPPPKKNQQ